MKFILKYNKTMNQCKSFLPSINNESEILILGSMPGIKSLEKQQYYAHPQNRFWKVMARLCKTPNLYELEYNEKLDTLLKNKIALWDTLSYCERSGSLDAKITNEKPNDIINLLKQYPNIKIICLNGEKSFSVFKKHFPNILDEYYCYKMPSTSPANAKFSLDKLIEHWNIINIPKF